MDSRTGVRWAIGVAFLVMVVGLVAADKDRNTITTRLSGLNETTATIQTKASGEFKATISEDGTLITYEETWRNLSSEVTQSHIHFGRPGLTGGIVLWLCYNPDKTLVPPITPPTTVPTPPICPTGNPATVTGTLTEANVVSSRAAARRRSGSRHRSGGFRRDGEGDPDGFGLRERAFGGSSVG